MPLSQSSTAQATLPAALRSRFSPRHAIRTLGCAVVLCATTWTLPLQAQEAPYAQVQRLINAGQLVDALQTADSWLGEQAKDPQMRFLKGVIQSQQGQNDAAVETFTLITQDYPELPEPYNNLAVLHAAARRYDSARAALEMAVQLNPSYATAQQNLGDVYTQLALQAYGQALKLNPENAALRPKLKGLQAVVDGNPKPKAAALPTSPSPSGW